MSVPLVTFEFRGCMHMVAEDFQLWDTESENAMLFQSLLEMAKVLVRGGTGYQQIISCRQS